MRCSSPQIPELQVNKQITPLQESDCQVVCCHILCVLYKPSRVFSRFDFKGFPTQQVI